MSPFNLLDPERPASNRQQLFASRRMASSLGSLRQSAQYFRASSDLVAAVNVALAVGTPLLLTGEPGTGKTQVAHYLAWYFGLAPESHDEKDPRFFQLDVRSTTTHDDLLYQFDAVAYFHAAHDPNRRGDLDRSEFVRPGPLWKALEAKGPSIVLLDEIDKAPRDFPNDLLTVLSDSEFHVRELDRRILRPKGMAPPFFVITSNSERRLPEPFLRRCVFHHIEFTEELVRRAVAARSPDYPNLGPDVTDAAIERLMDLRSRNLRKKPATAELLVWLTALSSQAGTTADQLRACPLLDLPALSVLVKDHEDYQALT